MKQSVSGGGESMVMMRQKVKIDVIGSSSWIVHGSNQRSWSPGAEALVDAERRPSLSPSNLTKMIVQPSLAAF